MYDFPGAPNPGDEYTPLAGGQTYVWNPPRWMVKGVPPLGGGGGGGGIDEAPVDGEQYARQDASWAQIDIPEGSWDSITDKPATFPPTVPIPWTDVSGKPATFPPTVPIPWTDVSSKPATFPPTLPIAWTDVSGKPATFPPTVPIAWTNISGKPATFPPDAHTHSYSSLTGIPSTFAPSAHGHPTSEITGLDAALADKAPTVHTHATADVTGLDAALAGKEPLIAGGTTVQFWRGDKSWQPIPASDWNSITGKPATFPPTLPISWTNVSGKPATFPPTVPIPWTDISSTPATFPPTLPITQADVTGLVADQSAQDTAIAGKLGDATSDGKVYARKDGAWVELPGGGAAIGDAAPSSPFEGQLWWNSANANLYIRYGTTWVQVNMVGS